MTLKTHRKILKKFLKKLGRTIQEKNVKTVNWDEMEGWRQIHLK